MTSERVVKVVFRSVVFLVLLVATGLLACIAWMVTDPTAPRWLLSYAQAYATLATLAHGRAIWQARSYFVEAFK